MIPGHGASCESRHHRVWRLKLAVLFSIVSKVSAAVTQLLALMLAVRLLGQEGYATYSAVVAISCLPVAFAIRNGPTFVARVAELESTGNRASLRQLLWSAMLPSAVTILIGGIVATAYLAFVDFTPQFPNLPGLATPGTRLVILGLCWLQFNSAILTLFESVQAGYQENHLLSVRSTLGNLVSIFLLAVVLPWQPTLLVLVLAVDGVVFLSRMLNSIILLIRRPYLLPARGCLNFAVSRALLQEAVIYTAVAGLGDYATIRLPVLLMASHGTVEATTRIAAVFQVILQLFSIVSMIAIPFVPALAHSLALGDERWGKRAIRRLSTWLLFYGSLCVVLLPVVGPWFFRVVLGESVRPGFWLLFSAGLYLAVLGLENFFFLVLCSLDRLPAAAGLFLLRAVATAIGSWFAVTQGSETAIFLGAAMSVVCVTLWTYPLMIKRSMRKSKTTLSPNLSHPEAENGLDRTFAGVNVP